jgi:peptidyl-prolyl cis-trans isomerase C
MVQSPLPTTPGLREKTANRAARARPLSKGMSAMIALARSVALAACLAFALPAFAQSDPVVAKVNGKEIRQSDLAAAEEELGQNAAQLPPDAKREYLISYLTDAALVAKAAEDNKIADDAEFKRKLASARTKILMEVYLTQEAKKAATDAEMRKVYEEAIKQVASEEEVSARHILVETEDEAKKIVADLKKGGDFAAIAKEKSKDPGSKDNGGDLGFFTKDQMVPEFAEVAYKLDKGQLSDPVKTQFGWHVIKVDDKRKKPAPTFEQVKDQVETFVVRKAQTELIQKLRADAKVEKFDKDGKPVPAEQKK